MDTRTLSDEALEALRARAVAITNGKAERFIKTALEEWAYARAYQTSDQQAEHLPIWLHSYNWHRQHGGIKNMIPIQTLGLSRNNLLRKHS